MCAPRARSRAAFPSNRPSDRIARAHRSHRRHHDTLRGGRLRAALVDVRARRLRRDPGEVDHARRLRPAQAAGSPAGKYTCIMFDRRECGQSGGRVERVTWAHFVAQGKGLLDHLNIERAHLMGGCMGCCPVIAFAVAYPQATQSMVLYWPVGGAKYRINGHQRFAEHLAYVQQHGLEQVVQLVTNEGKPFNADPRGGPWATVIRRDRAFAESYARQNADQLQAHRGRHGSHPAGQGHRARGRARRLAAPGHPRPDRSGPGRLPCDLGGEISRRMPASCRVLGRPRCRSDRGKRRDPAAAIPRDRPRHARGWLRGATTP